MCMMPSLSGALTVSAWKCITNHKIRGMIGDEDKYGGPPSAGQWSNSTWQGPAVMVGSR
ncbi:MAG: hypothetical protein ACKVHH_03080 [Candidatus Poseidoniales archaeon]